MATTVFSISQKYFDAISSAKNEWGEMFEHEETARAVDMHAFHGGIDHVDVGQFVEQPVGFYGFESRPLHGKIYIFSRQNTIK